MKPSTLVLSLALLSSGFVASALAADDPAPATKSRAAVKAETKDAAATGSLPNVGDKPNGEGERTIKPKAKKKKKVPTTPAS
jgi:Domain of unknown function (DUF4148)